ncbi:DNA polymerase II large subunit [Candidatus Woesearchaeota archaeon]|nr:DNA polymerase II large subunit [Candidatus Woesearchaeota archaeon]
MLFVAPYSPRVEQIFASLQKDILLCYDIANKTKTLGFDPDLKVKIPLARNMAERVEGLIASVAPEVLGKGIPERIQQLEQQYGSQDWRVALVIADEVAQQKFCSFDTKKKAIEIGIRVGFAYATVGVVSSPLEGFIEIQIRKRKDNGQEYFALLYGGPIRSAGGTGASVSVLIADYIRKKMGYATYDPSEKEVKRAYTELCDYHERVTNLQYFPSEEETTFLVQHLPVQIDGDPSEKFDVSNFKDLDRRVSNKISNGFCLVTAECLSLKAPKVWKQLAIWGKDMGLEQWNFMEEFVKLQKEIKARGAKVDTTGVVGTEKVSPDTTFIKDIVAGRPVFTYPLRHGGFRLSYGRGRVSGFSSDCVHPATMVAVDRFIAVGTQFKTERPGKSTTLNVCDTIEGPIVRLKSGDVLQLQSYEEAEKYLREIDEIIYLGDLLINWGDFQNRAHKLLPCGFVEEWWVYYAQKVFDQTSFDKEYLDALYTFPLQTSVSFEQAVAFSQLGVPLYPKYIFYWSGLKKELFLHLYTVLKGSVIENDKILVADFSAKRSLELIGCAHRNVPGEYVIISGDVARALLVNLGHFEKEPQGETTLELVNSVSSFLIKDKCGYFIGARMGRPEKAKMMKMIGSPHMLFPVGNEGGRLRSFQSALEAGKITSQFPVYFCEHCSKETVLAICENCGNKTQRKWYCKTCSKMIYEDTCPYHGKAKESVLRSIDSKYYFYKALERMGSRQYPDLIKGVRGMSSVEKIPEHLIKGILRAKYNLGVNKDGTVRYDMTELPCTHFKPKEVGTSVERLRELSYTHDVYGKELVDDNQVLELFAQDVILPSCPESPEEGADEILFRVASFIDELLEKLYRTEPFYKLKSRRELVGHLIVAMSPHTSAGIICRIVGFSKVQGFYAHPLLHSIMRRDCDGDENGCMLLMDTLLNFSQKYLPNTRGITQDAPLVLTGQLIPSEVDDMVFDMDIVDRYPLELYEAAQQYKNPWDVKIRKLGNTLGTEGQYEGMMFTHDTDNFNAGVLCSAYKILPTMKDKVMGQMEVARKLRAVDEHDVAKLVIERHFLRDIKGNLRKFSQQTFRCVKCNEIYRRPPLAGHCKCGGKLIFTISEGSIVKYLDPAVDLAVKYHLPPYLNLTLMLLRDRIESVFGKEEEKQEGLAKWF